LLINIPILDSNSVKTYDKTYASYLDLHQDSWKIFQ